MPRNVEDLNLSSILGDLGTGTEAIPFALLYPLSDLTGKQLGEFRAVWDTLRLEQRRRVVQAMLEFAEARFEVNFDAIFAHCLADPDKEIRAAAVDGLWENEQTSLIGPFLTMLRSDPSARVRSAAAAGLGRYVLAGELERLEPTIQARIVTDLLTTFHLAGESTDVRRRALESAAYACTAEVLELLDLAYFDDDEAMRLSAVIGMGRSCDKRWAENLLTELNSDSAAMRYEAALASGELGLRQAVPELAQLMHDADTQVRDASIHALGQIGGAEAKDALLSAYDDADDDTRAALDEALAEHALADGDLDFMLYEVDDGLAAEFAGDDLIPLWSADDDELGDAEPAGWQDDLN
jgi:HEAT repeat protein